MTRAVRRAVMAIVVAGLVTPPAANGSFPGANGVLAVCYKGHAISEEIRRLAGEEAVSIVRLSKQGAHGALGDIEAKALTRGAERLVERLEAG